MVGGCLAISDYTARIRACEILCAAPTFGHFRTYDIVIGKKSNRGIQNR